jgi:hypothetical protein
MPTNDFVEDAVESLERDPDLHFILLTCRPDRPHHSVYGRIKNIDQVAWIRRRVNYELDVLEQRLRKLP